MKNERLWAAFTVAVIIALCVAVIAACDDQPPQQVSYMQSAQPVQQAPVIIQQSHDGFWEGLMIGHLFSSGPTVVHHYDATRYVAPRQTVVNNTTIINKTAVKPAANTSVPPRSVAPSYSTPRATSYSGSYSSRPSYSVSSYSARSTFSSFSGRR
jgi:hypothetical protein